MNSQASPFCHYSSAFILRATASGFFIHDLWICVEGPTKLRRDPLKEGGVKDFLRALCLLTLVLIVGANGQTTNGNIQGTVVDPQNATVSGATVTARNMDTGLTVAAATTSAGVFALPNLPPGRYTVTVEAPGMKKHTQEGITVATNGTVGLDVQLQVGPTSESVTVTADAAQLETETSDIGTTVQNTLVDNLPLEVSGTIRNPVQFITLVAGFVGGVGNDPGSNSRSEEHTSELQSQFHLVCRLLLEKKNKKNN